MRRESPLSRYQWASLLMRIVDRLIAAARVAALQKKENEG
jgi:hypothetical protein